MVGSKEKCYVQRADYCTSLPGAEDNLAPEALVFMICGITGHGKHPITYSSRNKISASVQTQLIKNYIGLFQSENALVFDGAYNSQITAT